MHQLNKQTIKRMNTTRKSIEITEQDGMKSFTIFEVRARKINDEIITIDRFLHEKDALKCRGTRVDWTDMYKSVWVMEQQVFC